MKKSQKLLVILCITLMTSMWISLVSATEFVSNGDFEDGKTVWFFSGNSDVDMNTVYEGVYSGVLPTAADWIKQPGAGVWNDGAGGITNHTHLSFYGIHDGVGLHEIEIIIGYHDETSDILKYNLTDSWTKYNVFPDLDPVKGIYSIRPFSTVGATVDFYLDFVTFGDGAEPTPPPAPTPTPASTTISENFIVAASVVAIMFVVFNIVFIVQLMSNKITTEQFMRIEIGIMLLAIILLILSGVVVNY